MKIIKVRVKPGAKKNMIREVDGEISLEVWVKERAEKGKANKMLIDMLSEFFSCGKEEIEIIRGERSRIKTIRIGK